MIALPFIDHSTLAGAPIEKVNSRKGGLSVIIRHANRTI